MVFPFSLPSVSRLGESAFRQCSGICRYSFLSSTLRASHATPQPDNPSQFLLSPTRNGVPTPAYLSYMKRPSLAHLHMTYESSSAQWPISRVSWLHQSPSNNQTYSLPGIEPDSF